MTKAKSITATATDSATITAVSNNNPNYDIKPMNSLISKVSVGTRLDVYWPVDNSFYTCKVSSLDFYDDRRKYIETNLLYDDGTIEIIDLNT